MSRPYRTQEERTRKLAQRRAAYQQAGPRTDEARAKVRAYYAANKHLWKTPERKAKRAASQARSLPNRVLRAEQRRAATRARIARIKSGPCVDCRQRFAFYVMDFDHRRGAKRAGVSKMVSRGCCWKQIAAEIAKCDLVCANCHRIRSYADFLKRQSAPRS